MKTAVILGKSFFGRLPVKKYLLLAVLVMTVTSVSIAADPVLQLFDICGSRLTEFEMHNISGRLIILDIDPTYEIEEFDYSQTSSDPSREHCDIIAQNQADDLGLDTRDQSGRFHDYNEIVVDEIYQGYPDNRSSEPQPGTSGYYFTSSGSGKEHMGTYTRPSRSRTYTRRMNRSFERTESSAKVSVNYRPPGVKSQIFITLPKLPFFKRYHR